MSLPVRIAFIEFEQSVFSVLDTRSWIDTLICVLAYTYIIVFIVGAVIFPLSVFAYLFLMSPN